MSIRRVNPRSARAGAAIAHSSILLLCLLHVPRPTLAQEPQQMTMTAGKDPAAWRMPPMDMAKAMATYLQGRVPDVTPFVPGSALTDAERAALPKATARQTIDLADGDTLDLNAGLVLHDVGGRSIIMYAFNGQIPGPLLRVKQHSAITVNFTNNVEFSTTIRWHGVRVDNRFDGVPGLTQRPVKPGETFQYTVEFPDAGVYWYHPHQHADIAQDLGLYGNIIVEAPEEDYYNPVNREEVLLLDDILIDDLGLFPWGLEAPTHALMGRFGNVLMVNGRTEYNLTVNRKEVVRFYLTNASNTRIFNLSWGGAAIKLIAGDLGKFEREAWVQNVVIAPGQRYVVEVLFDEPGEFALANRIQAIDHFMGKFYSRSDTLGTITVGTKTTDVDRSAQFTELRQHPEVQADIDRVRPYFDRPVDRELVLTVSGAALPNPILQLMIMDTLYNPPVEWNETMPMMNWLATGGDLTWVLRDAADIAAGGEIGPAVGWRFKQGDIVKIRLFNNPKAVHPMNHPMHLHGQRFLLLDQDGVRSTNFVWRDTIVVPVGSTVDLLVEMSNPGNWMFNCQIPEHVGSGMAITLRVDPSPQSR
ncbi:MAG: multicopper oxidase family protein [Gemmatimonadales bacterium]